MGPVEEATKRDLGKLPSDLETGALAASALALARELDSDSSATSKSMCAKAHLEILTKLRELAPPAQKKGKLYDINEGRSSRLAEGQSGS